MYNRHNIQAYSNENKTNETKVNETKVNETKANESKYFSSNQVAHSKSQSHSIFLLLYIPRLLSKQNELISISCSFIRSIDGSSTNWN